LTLNLKPKGPPPSTTPPRTVSTAAIVTTPLYLTSTSRAQAEGSIVGDMEAEEGGSDDVEEGGSIP